MTVKITEFENTIYFVDEMIEGTFKYMEHKHEFVEKGTYTIMTDEFIFASPLGFIGKLVDDLVMNRYKKNRILDFTGQEFSNGKLIPNEKISVANLPNGIYIIQIISYTKEIKYGKFIKAN